ncbi:hypothetical protein HDU96_003011, partial [Phlyctochytrium bullatum]
MATCLAYMIRNIWFETDHDWLVDCLTWGSVFWFIFKTTDFKKKGQKKKVHFKEASMTIVKQTTPQSRAPDRVPLRRIAPVNLTATPAEHVRGPRPGSVRAAVLDARRIDDEYRRQQEELDRERRAQLSAFWKNLRDRIQSRPEFNNSRETAAEARYPPRHKHQAPPTVVPRPRQQERFQHAPINRQVLSVSYASASRHQPEAVAPNSSVNSAAEIGAGGLDFGPFLNDEHRRWAAFQGFFKLAADLRRISSKPPPYMQRQAELAEQQRLAAEAAEANKAETLQATQEPPQEAASNQTYAPTQSIENPDQAPTQPVTQAPAAPTQAPSALDGFGFSDLFSKPLATSIASGSTTAAIPPPPLSFIPDRTARPISSQPTVAAHTTSQAASASTQITLAPTPAPIPTQAPI